MNHGFRLKLIAGAVAALASASAQALVVTSSNSGPTSFSELVLVAYDDTKVGTGVGLTYLRGLGVQMNAFLPNSPLVTNPSVAVNAGAATQFAGGDKTPSTGLTLPFAGDAAWQTFLNRSSGADNIRWGVFGRRAGGAAVAGQYPAAVYTGVATPTNNGQVGTLSSAFNALMVNANGQGCDSAVSCITEIDVGSNLGAAIAYNGVGTLAQTLPFTLAFKNTNTNNQNLAPAFVPFCNSVDCADWSINAANGTVTYSLLGEQLPPPDTQVIPLPAAGWLLLTGLAGLAGLSRRKRNAG